MTGKAGVGVLAGRVKDEEDDDDDNEEEEREIGSWTVQLAASCVACPMIYQLRIIANHSERLNDSSPITKHWHAHHTRGNLHRKSYFPVVPGVTVRTLRNQVIAISITLA